MSYYAPWWIILVVLFLAFVVGLVGRLLSSRMNASTAGWLVLVPLLLIGMVFLGFISVRVEHRSHPPMEVIASQPPVIYHESHVTALAPPEAPLTPDPPTVTGQSIEEMWKQLTAPRINLEESTAAPSDAPTMGPSSPQELTAAARVILSASLPGADPFTQGWLVNAAKSILGMPVSEQEQLELHQAAVEALAKNENVLQVVPEPIVAATMLPQNGNDPSAHGSLAMSVSAIVQQSPNEPAKQAISKSIDALPKPDWVLNPPKQIGNVRKFVVTSDPFLTAEECRQDADEKMQNLALNRAAELSGAATRRTGAASLADLGLGGDYVRRELCTDEYVDVIDSSVGEMRKTYSLVEFNEAQDTLLIDRARSYSRQEGLLDVTLIGGGVLASVATLFGLLKLDTWTRGYYTKRLFLGVPAAIITVLTLLSMA